MESVPFYLAIGHEIIRSVYPDLLVLGENPWPERSILARATHSAPSSGKSKSKFASEIDLDSR
jgi:hypothetical protein